MIEDFNPTDVLALDDARADQQLAQNLRRQQEVSDFQWVMSTEAGRRYIYRLLGMTGVYRSSFTGNNTTFFNEGQRNIGLMIQTEAIEVCTDEYLLMMKERSK